MNHLVKSPKVGHMWLRWAETLGVRQLTAQFVGELERLATLCGYDGRGSLLEAVPPDGQLTVTVGADRISEVILLGESLERIMAALMDALTAIDKPATAIVAGDAKAFCRSAGVNHPWLALELIQAFGHAFVGYILAKTVVVTSWVEPTRGRVTEKSVLHIESVPGEDSAALLERCRESVSQFEAALAPPVPNGTIPDKSEESLKRYAYWFYLRHFEGWSIRAIAHHAFSEDAQPDDRTSNIRHGLKQAERFLSMTRYTFE